MHKFKHPLTLIFLSHNLHRKTFRLKNYNNELYTNFMPGQIKKRDIYSTHLYLRHLNNFDSSVY